MRRNSFFLLILLVACNACDAKRVFDSYVPITNQTWKGNQEISFPFIVKDTTTKNKLFVTIRNNNQYKFRNLLLIVTLNYPTGKKIVDTLACKMADDSGAFLGSGFTEIKENKFLYKSSMNFPTKGAYELSIAQAMQKETNANLRIELKGITDVGFRIEKETVR